MVEALARRHDRHHRLRPRPAGRRHQAPALRRGRGRRDRAGDAARARRCGCITIRRRAAAAAGRGAVHGARRASSACPAARWRPARRPTSSLVDLDEPWLVREDRHPLALEEHLLRGRAAAGQGPANPRWRAAQSSQADARRQRGRDSHGCSTALVVALVLRLSARARSRSACLITRAAGLGDVRKIGSGNIGATNVLRTGNKGLAALTLLLDALKGTAAVLIAGHFGAERGDGGRPRRLSRPSLSGLARLQGRQGRRHLSRRAARPCLAGRRWSSPPSGSLWPSLFRYSSLAALIGGARRARRALSPRPTATCALLFARHDASSSSSSTAPTSRGCWPAPKPGSEPRGERAAGRAAPHATAQRLAWLRLIRTRQCRPGHLPRPDQPLRLGRGGARGAARARAARRRPVASALPSPAEAEAETARRRSASARASSASASRTIRRCCAAWTIRRRCSRSRATPPCCRCRPVAIVGARNASLAGIKMARMLAADLGARGYAIVSGLARGIDAAAHEAQPRHRHGRRPRRRPRPALPAGEHAAAASDIAERGGASISEMPFGWEPRARDFPRRNRLVAGLSLGLVVVEAAQRSGSLISARLAGELGRLVFAVPGSPLDPRAAGTNGLLKDGAILVTEARDVLEALRAAGRRRAAADAVGAEEPRGFRCGAPPPARADRGADRRGARADAGRRRRAHPPHRPAPGAGVHGAAGTRPRRPARAPRGRVSFPDPAGSLGTGRPRSTSAASRHAISMR